MRLRQWEASAEAFQGVVDIEEVIFSMDDREEREAALTVLPTRPLLRPSLPRPCPTPRFATRLRHGRTALGQSRSVWCRCFTHAGHSFSGAVPDRSAHFAARVRGISLVLLHTTALKKRVTSCHARAACNGPQALSSAYNNLGIARKNSGHQRGAHSS